MMMKKPLVIDPCPVCGYDPKVMCIVVPRYHIFCGNPHCTYLQMVSWDHSSYTIKQWNKAVKKYRKKVNQNERF